MRDPPRNRKSLNTGRPGRRKEATRITDGVLFRSTNTTGRVCGDGITPKVLWEVVREAASRAGIEKLTPHDLRRYAECRIMPNPNATLVRRAVEWALIEVGLENDAA